jgi:hypothetical protein
VLHFVALTMHPMGLFLPSALVVNTLLSRKRIFAGLLCATVPTALYLPWLLHVWASRSALPAHRTGLSLSLGGHGANLGLLLSVFAVLGIVYVVRWRDRSLALIGALIGFAVVFPLGYGGRFLTFNVHWPLACLGGFGLACAVRGLEASSSARIYGRVLSLVVGCSAIVVFPSVDMLLPPQEHPGPPRGPMPEVPRGWHVRIQPGALLRLLDQEPRLDLGPPAGGADLIHRSGAEQFFAAVREQVVIGDVIFMRDPPGASLITGVTGRWTSDGILRDVKSREPPQLAEDCDFAAVLAQGPAFAFGPPKPPPTVPMPPPRSFGGAMRLPIRAVLSHSPTVPSGFEKVFANEFGSLWRNPNKPSHARQPPRPAISFVLFTVISVAGLALIAIEHATFIGIGVGQTTFATQRQPEQNRLK